VPTLALLTGAATGRAAIKMRELLSGPSWTSKIFNAVTTLHTYQFQILSIDPKHKKNN
jgi:hypothetical protein